MGRSPKSAAPPPPHAPGGGPTPRELEAPGASRWRTPPSSPALRSAVLGREPGRRGEKGRWEALVGHQPRGQWSAEARHALGHSLRGWKRGASGAGAGQGAARQEAIAHALGSPCALGSGLTWDPRTRGQTQCWFAPRGVVRGVTTVFDSCFSARKPRVFLPAPKTVKPSNWKDP